MVAQPAALLAETLCDICGSVGCTCALAGSDLAGDDERDRGRPERIDRWQDPAYRTW